MKDELNFVAEINGKRKVNPIKNLCVHCRKEFKEIFLKKKFAHTSARHRQPCTDELALDVVQVKKHTEKSV